jgi:hypothetical protein
MGIKDRGIQTWSGRLFKTCSTGSSPSPSDATTHHLRPDQNQSRQRAVLHTSVCTVLACLNAGPQYKPRQHILDAYADLSRLTRGGTD